MKRKACIVALIAAGLFVVMPDTVSAVLVDFSFTDDYLIENWKAEEGFNLPTETFGILFHLAPEYDFTVEEMSTNVPNWLVFHNSGVPLYFGYQGTNGSPFFPGSPIVLDLGTAEGTDFQFDFTLDSISSPFFLPGEEIIFSVELYYENGVGIAYSEGSMPLTGTPEPATSALLGLGGLFLLRKRS